MESVCVRSSREDVNFGSICLTNRHLVVNNDTGRSDNFNITSPIFSSKVDYKLLARLNYDTGLSVIVNPGTINLVLAYIGNLLIFERLKSTNITVCRKLDCYGSTIESIKCMSAHRALNRLISDLDIHLSRSCFIKSKCGRSNRFAVIYGSADISSLVCAIDLECVMSFLSILNLSLPCISFSFNLGPALYLSKMFSITCNLIAACHNLCNNLGCIKVVFYNLDCCGTIRLELITVLSTVIVISNTDNRCGHINGEFILHVRIIYVARSICVLDIEGVVASLNKLNLCSVYVAVLGECRRHCSRCIFTIICRLFYGDYEEAISNILSKEVCLGYLNNSFSLCIKVSIIIIIDVLILNTNSRSNVIYNDCVCISKVSVVCCLIISSEGNKSTELSRNFKCRIPSVCATITGCSNSLIQLSDISITCTVLYCIRVNKVINTCDVVCSFNSYLDRSLIESKCQVFKQYSNKGRLISNLQVIRISLIHTERVANCFNLCIAGKIRISCADYIITFNVKSEFCFPSICCNLGPVVLVLQIISIILGRKVNCRFTSYNIICSSSKLEVTCAEVVFNDSDFYCSVSIEVCTICLFDRNYRLDLIDNKDIFFVGIKNIARSVCVLNVKCIISIFVKLYNSSVNITVLCECRSNICRSICSVIQSLFNSNNEQAIFNILCKEVCFINSDCCGSICLVVLIIQSIIVAINNIYTRSNIINNYRIGVSDACRNACFVCRCKGNKTTELRINVKFNIVLAVGINFNILSANVDYTYTILNSVGVGKVINSGNIISCFDPDSYWSLIEAKGNTFEQCANKSRIIRNLQIYRAALVNGKRPRSNCTVFFCNSAICIVGIVLTTYCKGVVSVTRERNFCSIGICFSGNRVPGHNILAAINFHKHIISEEVMLNNGNCCRSFSLELILINSCIVVIFNRNYRSSLINGELLSRILVINISRTIGISYIKCIICFLTKCDGSNIFAIFKSKSRFIGFILAASIVIYDMSSNVQQSIFNILSKEVCFLDFNGSYSIGIEVFAVISLCRTPGNSHTRSNSVNNYYLIVCQFCRSASSIGCLNTYGATELSRNTKCCRSLISVTSNRGAGNGLSHITIGIFKLFYARGIINSFYRNLNGILSIETECNGI